MKTCILYLIASLNSFLFVSCYKYEIVLHLPTVTTNDITNISESTASGGGDVIKDGHSLIVSRGLCWDTIPNPTVHSSKSETMGCKGDFDLDLANLKPGKTYYVRAYAENMNGTAYGANKKFSTVDLDIRTIVEGKSITSMITGGEIEMHPNTTKRAIIHKQGICYASHPNPTTKDMICLSSTNEDNFFVHLNNLNSGTNYYIKAYVTTNSGMTYYGDEQIINTDVLFND